MTEYTDRQGRTPADRIAVRDGGQAIGLSPTMFGWGKTLSDQEIRDMCAFVRSLAPTAPPAH